MVMGWFRSVVINIFDSNVLGVGIIPLTSHETILAPALSTLKDAPMDAGPFMLDITKDIHSLTTFRRRSGDFMKQLRKSKRPVVLTVKGRVAAVVQDAGAYQRLLDIAARADAREGIRQGLEDARAGRSRPIEDFFAEFKAKHGIPD